MTTRDVGLRRSATRPREVTTVCLNSAFQRLRAPHLSRVARAERGSYVGCIAGVLSKQEYLDSLTAAGFKGAQSLSPTRLPTGCTLRLSAPRPYPPAIKPAGVELVSSSRRTTVHIAERSALPSATRTSHTDRRHRHRRRSHPIRPHRPHIRQVRSWPRRYRPARSGGDHLFGALQIRAQQCDRSRALWAVPVAHTDRQPPHSGRQAAGETRSDELPE